jgi:hypothetical protein
MHELSESTFPGRVLPAMSFNTPPDIVHLQEPLTLEMRADVDGPRGPGDGRLHDLASFLSIFENSKLYPKRPKFLTRENGAPTPGTHLQLQDSPKFW